jgi:hypothetical protein
MKAGEEDNTMKAAKHLRMRALCLSALVRASTSSVLRAQQGAVTPENINSLGAPAKTDSRIGTLEFKDGMPAAATVEKAYDYLDFAHAGTAGVDRHREGKEIQS